MTLVGLAQNELDLIVGVFRSHPEVVAARIFGSRAKGTHTPRSDVDLAVWGDVDDLTAARIAADLDELPLPYHFDVKPVANIALPALREHIDRVGILVYPPDR